MAIQVNIFEAGSVPTAQEFVTLINELNTTLDESVTLTEEQSITGVKTFLGSKLLKFKQSVSADKLGFTLYDYQNKEVGNFEYDNKNNFRLLALGNYVSAANQEVECNIGFKIYNKLQSAAYRLLCPLAGNAKNSIPTLSETYTNFYMPLVFTNGAASVSADNSGKVDLSTLIGSGSGDVSGLATVATTGDYNDLLNLPTLFSGSYNDLTNKPTLFSGDYNDLTNKPTIPVVDITKAQADGWYQPKDNYALASELFSGSYNDLTDKPSLFSGNYNDLTNKPTLFSGSYNDLSDKPTIPTVPTISTNITSDAASDTKTASPKAVKDFVEGKGYLTQHQDISGKADQTDLEALEDRVETLEQSSGGGTTQYSYLKLIPDLDAYTEAPVGEIVKFTGKTGKYTRGWDYEFVGNGEQITIPKGSTIITHLFYPEDSITDTQRIWNDYISTTQTVFYQQDFKTVDYGNNDVWSVNWSFDSEIGELVYARATINGTAIKIITPITATTSNSVSFEYGGETITIQKTRTDRFVKFINTEGHIEYYMDTVLNKRDNTNSSLTLIDMTNRKVRDGWVNITKSTSPIAITIGSGESPWQPIIYPTAPVNSGD